MERLAQLSVHVYERWQKRSTTSKRICIFLGAGADISSGGITFGEFKRQCIEDLCGERIFDITSQASIDQKFQVLFEQNKNPENRALLIERIFRKMESLTPSDSYKLLVLLAEEGAVDAVVTTNFDIMLEAAQEQLQRNIFQTYSPGIARPYPITPKSFDLPKRPYIKLHGDLAARAVLHLTNNELELPHYDPITLQLLTKIAQTHDLVFAGYSGFDPELARVIGQSIKDAASTVYWCNIHAPEITSPLFKSLPRSRLHVIKASFDELIKEIARPVLEKPKACSSYPVYIRSLFNWRVEYCNKEYVREYGERAGFADYRVFIKRRSIEGKILRFLQSDRTLAVLAGPSGYGKSTMGIRLLSLWQGDEARRILLIKSKSLTEPNLESYLSQQLGGLGPAAPFSLFILERWLKTEGVRLVLFVDAINEYSTELTECVRLFRTVMRLAYFLPEFSSSIRIIATVRQETWNALVSRLDPIQLQQSLWSDSSIENTLNAITVTPFSDDEVREALNRLRDARRESLQIEKLLPSDIERLRDPFLFSSILASTAEDAPQSSPVSNVYQRVFEAKIRNNGAGFDPSTLRECLASLALRCMERQQDTFRPIDVHPRALDNHIVRILKDLGIIVDAEFGFLRFAHDRIQEYFLAIGLSLPEAPNLEHIEDLEEFLLAFRHNTKVLTAARIYFSLQPERRFGIIESALRLAGDTEGPYLRTKREMLLSFAKEVLLTLTEDAPRFARDYITSVITEAKRKNISLKHLRLAVQAAAYLPVEISIPLLSDVELSGYELAATESNIYAIDKLAHLWFRSGCPYVDLLRDRPYSSFFDNEDLPIWRQLGRILGLISLVGPDNTYPSEYVQFCEIVESAIRDLCARTTWSSRDTVELTSHILRNSDRLVFNATSETINSFFKDTDRARFISIIDELQTGHTLNNQHFELIRGFFQSIRFDLEFHAANALFVVSAINGLAKTLSFWESYVEGCSDETPPVEVDLLQAASVYLVIIFDIPYTDRFSLFEEKILSELPSVFLFRPGLTRGLRRGFQDQFDMVFEDGFGVIYPYGLLRPSVMRRQFRFRDYMDELGEEEQGSWLPLYTRYLHEFLNAGKTDEAIQMLHALCQVSLTWPLEGLSAMREVVGHVDPVIRRAVVRILSELYNRRPYETTEFLRRSGSSLSDEDLQEIKMRQDPRIGARQIEEHQWARIIHFLFRSSTAKEKFVRCVRTVLTSGSFEEAVRNVLDEIGFLNQAGTDR